MVKIMLQPTDNSLFFGIDRLELYCEGRIDPEIYASLEKLSEKAKEAEKDIEAEELGCVVLHKAYGRFPIALRWKQVLLRVGAFRSQKSTVEPVAVDVEGKTKRENLKGEQVTHRAKLDCFSEYCNARSLPELQKDTRGVLETLFCRLPSDIKISRVDIARDTLHAFTRRDKARLVTHARKIADFTQERVRSVDSSLYNVGETFTGFVIGAGKKRLRIYNKTEEILTKHTQSRYTPLYLDRKAPVWRVEFQLRKGKNWNLYHHNFSTCIPYLWKQLTTLTRFCTPSKDKQKDRWKTAKFWSILQNEKRLGEGFRPATKKHAVTESKQLFAQAWGVLQKAAALEHIEDRDKIIQKMIDCLEQEKKEWRQGLHKKQLQTLQSDKLHQTTPQGLRNKLLGMDFH